MIPLLQNPDDFPPVEKALLTPPGLLAAGGQLTPEWLLAAYSRGIFPWFTHGEPLLWWSLNPRLILLPEKIRVTRSLAKMIRKRHFDIRCDTDFAAVIHACAAPRAGAAGTWITPSIIEAYCRMHELGYAHSIESWHHGKLVGGLYGIALGRVFFGESMFSHESNASKVALVNLANRLYTHRYSLIDCQMDTKHLSSMGAHTISRNEFIRKLQHRITQQPLPGCWDDYQDFYRADRL